MIQLSSKMERLTPYVPGEQPQDRSYLKLNTNENPYPPGPAVEKVLQHFDTEALRRYPDPESLRLRKALAHHLKLQTDNVFVGNGSDEVLAFAFYAFFDSRRGPLLFPSHTYSFYPVYCDLYGIESRPVPLEKDFSIDLEAYLQTDSCGVIIANPNAPTGIHLQLDPIADFLSRYPDDRVVIIDEAYIEFGGQSAVALLEQHNNLMVIRTYSKSMSLAGTRIGYALADKTLIAAVNSVKNSFNSYPLDALAQQIGEAAIGEYGYHEKACQRIIANREKLRAGLSDAGWQVLPSAANFVFARCPGQTGAMVYQRLKDEGILVRQFNQDQIRDFVRITIGTQDQMDRLLATIGRLWPR